MTVTFGNKSIAMLIRAECLMRFHKGRLARVKRMDRDARHIRIPTHGGYKERMRRARNIAKHGSPG